MRDGKDPLFGDALALARRAWVRAMTEGLARRGYYDYRRSDALALRVFAAGPLSVGAFAQYTDTSRQASRKVIDTLVERGYLVVSVDETDARRRLAHLTEEGQRYAEAVIATVTALNDAVVGSLPTEDLAAALRVLDHVRRQIRW